MTKRKKAKILRKGFERGAQWAIINMAHNSGSGIVILPAGLPSGDEARKIVDSMLLELFVPKPVKK
jgi:hypothetical protein